MARPARATRSQLLATIRGPRRIRIYRAAFRPFESTRYLDVRALAKVRKATIELGMLEAGGLAFPFAAEVRRGMITSLTPLECPGCPTGKESQARLKKILAEVTGRIEDTGERYLRLPVPLAISARTGASLTIGPIVIIIDDDAPCIWIWYHGSYCLICTFGAICG